MIVVQHLRLTFKENGTSEEEAKAQRADQQISLNDLLEDGWSVINSTSYESKSGWFSTYVMYKPDAEITRQLSEAVETQ